VQEKQLSDSGSEEITFSKRKPTSILGVRMKVKLSRKKEWGSETRA
jgi:hypothetical protein